MPAIAKEEWIDLGHWCMFGKVRHRPARRRDPLDLREPTNQDVAVAIPCAAQDPERVAERLHRPSRMLDLLQFGISAKKPMYRLSGDQNGCAASSFPANSFGSSASSGPPPTCCFPLF